MKKTFLKLLAVILSFLPLFCAGGKLVRAWLRCDNGIYPNAADPVFALLGIVTALFLIWRRRKEAGACDPWALPLLFVSGAGILIGLYWSSNAAYYAGAILFPASVIWFLFGWRLIYRLFPAPLLLLLGLPTTMYLYFFPDITLNWKIGIACALCLYAFFALLTDFNPIQRKSAFFAAGVLIYGLLYAAIPPIAPLTVTGGAAGDYRDTAVYSRITRPDILPPAFELKLRGAELLQETQKILPAGNRNVAVTELVYRTAGKTVTLCYWYETTGFSTGDYKTFRRRFHKNGGVWHMGRLSKDAR